MSEKSALHGKAFEYAAILAIDQQLGTRGNVQVVDSSPLLVAKRCYASLESTHQAEFIAAANAGVSIIIAREPRLEEKSGASDPLEIRLQTDQKGQAGDVRDIVLRRPTLAWEIGISAKNNHKAVKSSRLAKELDFGASWFGQPCSSEYRKAVREVFEDLQQHVGTVRWRELEGLGIDKFSIYVKVLDCFREELLRMYGQFGELIPQRLISYLVGNFDFYKIIKLPQSTHVQPFNLRGTLGLKSKTRKGRPEAAILTLPRKIYDAHYITETSKTTVVVACDAGWHVSFRIHNASEFVEPSLKFDVILTGQPPELVTQEMPWEI